MRQWFGIGRFGNETQIASFTPIVGELSGVM
jgi:hypothetical protein